MKQIRFFVLIFLTLIGASHLNAQNDLILMYNMNDYDWYTYNITRPANQQISRLKLTEFRDGAPKEEKIYLYDSNGLLSSISKISYSQNENIPYDVNATSYFYSKADVAESNELVGIFGNSEFNQIFYDNLGRINKIEEYSKGLGISRLTKKIAYEDPNSNVIKTMYIETDSEADNGSLEFKYIGNTVTVSLKDEKDNEEVAVTEFQKVDNKWLVKKADMGFFMSIYNEDGLETYSRVGKSETNYEYNQNDDLVKEVHKNADGTTNVKEYDYEYNSRLDWIKRWTLEDGKRTLSAEREFIYLEP